MSLQAYKKTASQAENPKDTEYRLFVQVTQALIKAKDLPKEDVKARIDVVDWNRQVWSALATACADKENALSNEIRAGVISLSIWVNKHSSDVMRGEDNFDHLIELNKMIMEGLSTQKPAPKKPDTEAKAS